MRKTISSGGFLLVLVLGAGILSSFAGDSLYGTVTAVKSGEVVVLEYGPPTAKGRYDIRIAGIEAPREGAAAREAKQFLAHLVLGKPARMRFERRAPNGEMISRLITAEPVDGVRDVSVMMLRAGVARRQARYQEKYGELAAAETEAQTARRGLWAPATSRKSK